MPKILLNLFATYRVYIIVGALLVSLVGSGVIGYRAAAYVYNKAYTKELEETVDWYENAMLEIQQINNELRANEKQVEIVYRTVKEKVVEYVDKNPDLSECELDADGLRLWNGEAQ